jgi:hypothetical protein
MIGAAEFPLPGDSSSRFIDDGARLRLWPALGEMLAYEAARRGRTLTTVPIPQIVLRGNACEVQVAA